eukprot:130696-Hanusia_phi.AAC.1
MIALEAWAFDVGSVLAGYLGAVSLDAHGEEELGIRREEEELGIRRAEEELWLEQDRKREEDEKEDGKKGRKRRSWLWRGYGDEVKGWRGLRGGGGW